MKISDDRNEKAPNYVKKKELNNVANCAQEHYDVGIGWVRFIALCSIILCHFLQYYQIELAWWFNVGVQVFFVISGYLYGKKEVKDPVTFIKRRVMRLLPQYWIVVLLASILTIVLPIKRITIGKLGRVS